ncbi:FtsX-like permease family protein [Roseospira marina]|uniref:FtsX-like permease family protein n=1 Tax=Roseospira marina TaxID=140057 RepID=A0A5M6IIL5_9PROT|nr:FtsX-like permease family protein [Roseospira marina]KAA5607428.1 FtsX-like permease family protein [Roseospira marina]MBB4312395.1 putative ABC transport system permease protein [Roseospira marina]MBB5085589.1 putative ABC transport system permease protein [Roseospira marina]
MTDSVIRALPLSVRLALRELRGGLAGFRVLVACLALGVFAIAAAGSMNRAIQAGLEADAQALLGGDLEVERRYQPPDTTQRTAMEAMATVSQTVDMRAMAIVPGDAGERALVELKAVDDAYPLYGTLELTGRETLSDALAQRGDVWGAVADPNLLTRLGVNVGAFVRVGDATVQIRDTIAREPDRVASLFSLGPRLMIHAEALPATALIQPGSLVEYDTLLRADKGVPADALRTRLTDAFPEAGWRIRGTDRAAPGLTRFLENLTLYLTLVGLTALLVGGIGVANATRAYLQGRMTTIATLKCLGAPAGTIFRVYFIQIGLLALLGVAIGVAAGVGAPFLVQALAGDWLPIRARVAVYAEPALLALASGALVALVFAVWPLARARDIPALAIFKGALADPGRWPRPRYLLLLALALGALVAVTALSAVDQRFALVFVAGAAVSMGLFGVAALGVQALARRCARLAHGRPGLRLALANLHRPGAATGSVVLSLGLGLSVLVIVALIQGNMTRQIDERLPAEAPSFFFIDLQPGQVDGFRAILEQTEGVGRTAYADMVRGRITRLDGVPVGEANVAPDAQWAIRGDRGFTTGDAPPNNAEIVRGSWWPVDYDGPPLFSLTEELAQGFGLDIGETMTVNILGREITGTLANTRKVDWGSLRINFTFMVSPGALTGAPRTWIATVRVDDTAEAALERAVTDAYPNVSAIRVKGALETVRGILDTAARAITATAAVTLAAGALVLAGAFAAGHGRRVYEAVVLKVVGATRGDLLRGYLLEYGLLGLATGLIAAAVGTAGAWAVIVFVMKAEWTFLPDVVLTTLVACVLVTLAAGYLGTWRALSGQAAPYLRNE